MSTWMDAAAVSLAESSLAEDSGPMSTISAYDTAFKGHRRGLTSGAGKPVHSLYLDTLRTPATALKQRPRSIHVTWPPPPWASF